MIILVVTVVTAI